MKPPCKSLNSVAVRQDIAKRLGVRLSFVPLFLCLGSPAATINFQLERFTGATNNRPITISLASDPLAQTTNIVFGVPITLQPTNSRASINLLAANYWVSLDQVPAPMFMPVPDSTNIYNAVDLIRDGLKHLVIKTNYVIIDTNALSSYLKTNGDASALINVPFKTLLVTNLDGRVWSNSPTDGYWHSGATYQAVPDRMVMTSPFHIDVSNNSGLTNELIIRNAGLHWTSQVVADGGYVGDGSSLTNLTIPISIVTVYASNIVSGGSVPNSALTGRTFTNLTVKAFDVNNSFHIVDANGTSEVDAWFDPNTGANSGIVLDSLSGPFDVPIQLNSTGVIAKAFYGDGTHLTGMVWTNDPALAAVYGVADLIRPTDDTNLLWAGTANGSSLFYVLRPNALDIKVGGGEVVVGTNKAGVNTAIDLYGYDNGDGTLVSALAFGMDYGYGDCLLLDPKRDNGQEPFKFSSSSNNPVANGTTLFPVQNGHTNKWLLKGNGDMYWGANATIGLRPPATNGSAGQALVTDGNTPQQLSYQSFLVDGGAAVTNISVTNITVYQTFNGKTIISTNIYVSNAFFTNVYISANLALSNLPVNSVLGTDAARNATNINIGSGLSFSGNTLSASGIPESSVTGLPADLSSKASTNDSRSLSFSGSNWLTGALDLEFELRTTNAVGTSGQILTSAGSGKAPYWAPAPGGGAATSEAFVTIGNSSGLSAERALTGTANQITVTDGGANSAVTLSTPQNIHTAATPQFAGLGLGVAAPSGGERITESISPGTFTYFRDDTNSAIATTGGAAANQTAVQWHLGAQGWKNNATAASQPVDLWLTYMGVQGNAAATSLLVISNAINGGTPTDILHINSAGFMTIGSSFNAGGNLQAGNGFAIDWGSSTILRAPADGAFHVRNNAETQTNFFVDASGNANVKQTLTAGDSTHGVIVSNITASSIVGTDAGKQLTNINIGSGLTFSANTLALNSTPSSVIGSNPFLTASPVSAAGFRRWFAFQSIGETGSTTTGYSTWGWTLANIGTSVQVAATASSMPYSTLYQSVAGSHSGFQDVNTAGAAGVSTYNNSLWFEFDVQPTNSSGSRFWAGISDQFSTGLGNTQDVTNNVILFRASTNSANWFCLVADGTTANVNDTGLPYGTTKVKLGFVYQVGVQVIGYTNGVACFTNTTHLPTGIWTPIVRVSPTTSSMTGMKLFRFYGEQDP